MFKNFKYRSANMSVHILRGHITFRYWAQRVKGDSHPHDEKFPCRIKVRLDGFEWFIYNRTSAYEFLRKILEQDDPAWSEMSGEDPTQDGISREAFNRSSESNATPQQNTASSGASILDKLVPIELVGTRGSISLGNPDLPSICVLYYKEVNGIYGAEKVGFSEDGLRRYGELTPSFSQTAHWM
jgi:hypothetical protein